MKSNEIKKALKTHLGKSPGYDAASAQQVADGLAHAMSAIAPSKKQPTKKQQQWL